ncbi:MAG: hypothetical protein JWR80_8008 [Bradyrhizobium sp.]|nr:hypothetical protein [Bradyrhizobium sp.]
MSNKDFGGKMSMKLSTGELISLRGTLTMNPSRNSIEAITNQDMSVDRTATPKPATFEINFADRGLNLDRLMKSDRMNITFDEDFTGVTHYFTQAFLVGDPQINRINGEVTGITGAAETYTRRG